MKQFNLATSIFLVMLLGYLLGCASTATQEGTGEYIDDSVITAKVKVELFDRLSIKAGEVTVETFKGEVQLSGFVNSQATINKAVEAARRVKGVKSVKNDMLVKGEQR